MPLRPVFTGSSRCVVVLSPNCPTVLAPHVHTVPSVFSEMLWLPPAETFDAPVIVVSFTGVSCRLEAPPSPSCPFVFHPQEYTDPSALVSNMCCPPAETLLTPVSAAGCIGSHDPA